jgi:hypothetical protein
MFLIECLSFILAAVRTWNSTYITISSYFKENTSRLHHKHKFMFRKTTAVYFKDHTKLISNLRYADKMYSCRSLKQVASRLECEGRGWQFVLLGRSVNCLSSGFYKGVKTLSTRFRFVSFTSWVVSIVSDYGLDDRAIGVRSPAGAKDFSSNLCPYRLWDPPSLLYNGYRGSFPRG